MPSEERSLRKSAHFTPKEYEFLWGKAKEKGYTRFSEFLRISAFRSIDYEYNPVLELLNVTGREYSERWLRQILLNELNNKEV